MSAFAKRVWDACNLIPRGKVISYSELGRYLGSRGFQAIGQALRRNPNAPYVPCHRVVNGDGGLGGYAHGIDKKRDLLLFEGVIFHDGDKIMRECFTHIK